VSSNSSAAAFLASSEGRIYTFTNVNQSPSFSGLFQVGSLGAVSALAVSDDGSTVAVGVSDGETGALYVASTGHSMRLVASMTHPAAIAFLHNSNNAVVADDATNTVSVMWDGQVFPVASGDDGISKPVALGISNDNARVFVGNAQSGSVTIVGPNGNIAQPLPCKCTLTGLFPTSTDSVFRLTDFSGGPVLLLDANRPTPRITFVPMRGSQF
jgi:DNA-binding beta-propeller fold protein YncE